jgi:hypothetical protein
MLPASAVGRMISSQAWRPLRTGEAVGGPPLRLSQRTKFLQLEIQCRIDGRFGAGQHDWQTARMAAPLRLDTYMRIALKLFNQQSHLSR